VEKLDLNLPVNTLGVFFLCLVYMIHDQCITTITVLEFTDTDYCSCTASQTFSLWVTELDSEPDDIRRLRHPNNYINTQNTKYQIIIINAVVAAAALL